GQVQSVAGGSFPWGTLFVNVLGSAVLGVLVELMALVWSPAEEVRAFLTVGMLGALTTFSAYSLELVLMMQRGEWISAALYMTVSVVFSVGALLTAMAAIRGMLV